MVIVVWYSTAPNYTVNATQARRTWIAFVYVSIIYCKMLLAMMVSRAIIQKVNLYLNLFRFMWTWKRNSNDPLLNVMLKKYHLNLLSIPRENVKVCDLYMQDGSSNQVSTPGNIINFVTPQIQIPKIAENEKMSDITGQASNDISGQVGLDFLKGFLDKLSVAGLGGKIMGNYEGSKNNKIVFSFSDARRDSVDPFLLGSELKGRLFMKDNPLYAENRRYYVVTGIAKSKSINIELQGDEKQAADLTASISQIVDASGKLKLEKNQSGKITYTGDKDLAFGVELYEIGYSDEQGRFVMSPNKNAITLRGDEPAFIGDKDEGDVFIYIKS